MITPTWNNAPRLSDLRIEQRAHEAKKAHKASMFPNYAGHSGIEKSRKDRKTLIKRKWPGFLKRRPDLDEKHIYTVKQDKQERFEVLLRQKISFVVHGLMVEGGAHTFSQAKGLVATVGIGKEEITIEEVEPHKRVGLEKFHVDIPLKDLTKLKQLAGRELEIVGELPLICLPSLLVVFWGLEFAIDVPQSEDEWKIHLPN
jgi:hypothetical protein